MNKKSRDGTSNQAAGADPVDAEAKGSGSKAPSVSRLEQLAHSLACLALAEASGDAINLSPKFAALDSMAIAPKSCEATDIAGRRGALKLKRPGHEEHLAPLKHLTAGRGEKKTRS